MTASKPVRRFFIQAVDGAFDLSRDAAVAPWCFVKADQNIPGWEQLLFEDPFGDEAELEVHAEACISLTHWLISQRVNEMNRRHSKNYSRQYWSILLKPWLLMIVQYSWGHFKSLGNALATLPDEEFEVQVAPEISDWRFKDFGDLHNRGLMELEFAFWLNSLALAALKPENCHLLQTPLSFRPPPRQSIDPETGTQKLKTWIKSQIRIITAPGMNAAQRLFFSAVLSLAPRKPGRPLPKPAGDQPPPLFPKPFLRMLEVVIKTTEPHMLRAGYADLHRRATRRNYDRGSLFVGLDLFTGVEDVFIAAHAEEAGARVVPMQHGGNYGSAKIDIDAAEMEYCHEAFLTWGQSKHGDYPGRFVPLPSPKLSRFHRSHRERTASLIFVTTQHRLLDLRPRAWPQPTQWLEARREKIDFFGRLDAEIHKSVKFRPYLDKEPNLDVETYVICKWPNLDIAAGPLWDYLKTCRLLVLDHPGTTLNIAMAADVPTLCLWNDSAWPMTPEGQDTFDAFKACGMLHGSAAGAADWVNANWANIGDWWAAAETRAAKERFTRDFAVSSRLWWWDWMATLWKL